LVEIKLEIISCALDTWYLGWDIYANTQKQPT